MNEVLDEPNRRALRSTLADLATLTNTLAKRASTIDATLLAAARTMDNAVRRLREKIEADPTQPSRLVTVWGVGYRWDPADVTSGSNA